MLSGKYGISKKLGIDWHAWGLACVLSYYYGKGLGVAGSLGPLHGHLLVIKAGK